MGTPNCCWLEYTHHLLYEKGLVPHDLVVPGSLERQVDQGLLNGAPLLSRDDMRRKLGGNQDEETLRRGFGEIAKRLKSPCRCLQGQIEESMVGTRAVNLALEKMLFVFSGKPPRECYRTVNMVDVEGKCRGETVFRSRVAVGKEDLYLVGMYVGPDPARKISQDLVFEKMGRLLNLRGNPAAYLRELVDLTAQCLPYWRASTT